MTKYYISIDFRLSSPTWLAVASSNQLKPVWSSLVCMTKKVPLLTNCTLWQAMQICTRVQQLCIRLNSSKIHSSNNNLTACTAPFIPPHSSQLRILRTYQLPQPRIQYPLSFEYFTCCTLSARVFLPSQQ